MLWKMGLGTNKKKKKKKREENSYGAMTAMSAEE
jgi:hypothetical protein